MVTEQTAITNTRTHGTIICNNLVMLKDSSIIQPQVAATVRYRRVVSW